MMRLRMFTNLPSHREKTDTQQARKQSTDKRTNEIHSTPPPHISFFPPLSLTLTVTHGRTDARQAETRTTTRGFGRTMSVWTLSSGSRRGSLRARSRAGSRSRAAAAYRRCCAASNASATAVTRAT
eukprot:TRINITY_DN948_c0_g1_i5.p1 TRINITY_DN948_c0_g1~~TRINITY_DN948_c0_g1_i5.p1  ORF type:complete len:126 (+),score=12.16 TRINITY_DN948_c0_g1_i5:243-620(+)